MPIAAKIVRADPVGGFRDCPALCAWVAKPAPQTDKAVEVVEEFIARRLKA